jgi:glycine oxidase
VNHTEVAIAGAGIIGLSLALELAAAGRQVTVFERGRAMSESSWAAAGMLAAGDPENPPALRSLSELSRALYPQFLARVAQLSGQTISIRTTRTIQGAHHIPAGFSNLDPKTLSALAPGIRANGLKFFLLEESSLNPRDLAQALPLAARAAGVIIHEETPVLNVHPSEGTVRFTTPSGNWTADTFVHAAGAWSESLTGVPSTPRKGQMVQVHHRGPEHPESGHLEVVLRTPEIYLVPRGNGHIVIGATVEDIGYDKVVDPRAIAALLETAADLWPPIRTAAVVDTWAGLRPGSPDGLPIIGPLEDDARARANTWIAAGHFRNGILLAPGTALLLLQMILNQPLSVDPSPFRCGRFAPSSVQPAGIGTGSIAVRE